MDSETRHAVIGTILTYAATSTDDIGLLELVGWTPCRIDATDEQAGAVIAAVVPLLPDAQLDMLMRHIAEVLVCSPASLGERVALDARGEV